jgi:hypothetical protein
VSCTHIEWFYIIRIFIYNVLYEFRFCDVCQLLPSLRCASEIGAPQTDDTMHGILDSVDFGASSASQATDNSSDVDQLMDLVKKTTKTNMNSKDLSIPVYWAIRNLWLSM